MTQAGKRRRAGVVDAPDFDGLYAGEKAVKKRRTGVTRAPSLEELQVPEHHAVLAGNAGACDGNNSQHQSAVVDEEEETTNGPENKRVEAAATK